MNKMGSRVLHRERSQQSGQVAILFALVFTFMFILFAMVVDFAHLVNVKINLQNAADAAAYSGAAWQAQTLTRLGQMNYRLRQNVKEMSMRLEVVHLRHNRNYPDPSQRFGGASAPNTLEPMICQQAHGYTALSGLQYDNNTNLCRNASASVGGLPPIVIPPVIADFDPYAIAIQSQIRAISDAAGQECAAAASDNLVLAQYLANLYTSRSQFHSDQMNQIIQWLNAVGSGDAANNQHPIAKVALQSARRNLSLANRDNFKMQILGPRGGEYLRMNDYRMRASILYVKFQTTTGGGCVGIPAFYDFDGMIAGKTKEQSIVTYFAVKLSSQPRMLFMPQKWIEAAFPTVVAFSAAKPFGSRMGPDSVTDILLPVPNRPGNASRTVNFSFFPGDQLGMVNTKMMAYFNSLMPFNSIGRPDGNQNTGWPDVNKAANLRLALQAIRAPTVFDAMMYTVLPDPNSSRDYMEPNYAMALWPDYLEQGDPNNQIINTPQPPTPPYFPTSGQKGQGWIPSTAPNSGSTYGSISYAQEGPGSHSVTSAVGLPDINEGSAKSFGFATPDLINSGWAPVNAAGRVGYSVKFIGFDALVHTMKVRVSGSQNVVPIQNPPTGDNNVEFIKH